MHVKTVKVTVKLCLCTRRDLLSCDPPDSTHTIEFAVLVELDEEYLQLPHSLRVLSTTNEMVSILRQCHGPIIRVSRVPRLDKFQIGEI